MLKLQENSMQVIGVLSQKGGAGKTTLALHWAVMAMEATSPTAVAVIDTDSQRSAAEWGERRASETPAVLEANESNLEQAIDACRDAGMKWVIVDSMPRVESPSVKVARLADLVVIPCGPTVLDISAIGATIAITERVKVPAVIVMNQCRHSSTINERAAQVLADYGLPICPTFVMRRAALEDAFVDGSAVTEIEPKGKGAAEIRESWTWIQQQANNL